MDRKLDQTLVLLNMLTKSLVVSKSSRRPLVSKKDSCSSEKTCDGGDVADNVDREVSDLVESS